MPISRLVLIVWLLLVAGHPAGAAPAASPLGVAIDAYIRPFVESGDLSSQLLVVRHGRVVVERSYGLANRELNVPVTPETRCCIASVTKPMTATIAIQLMVEKKLGYHDALSRWIPGFPQGDSITVEWLLRHRSGIPHRVIPDSEMTRPFTAAEIAERAKTLPLDFPPGSRYQHSSGGFGVLARVLELASGKTYGELLEGRILRPLGMSHTSEIDSRAVLPGRADDYVPGPDGDENGPLRDYSGIVGAGSVWSTARDVLKFAEAVMSGKFGPSVQQSFVRQGKLDFNGETDGSRRGITRSCAGSPGRTGRSSGWTGSNADRPTRRLG